MTQTTQTTQTTQPTEWVPQAWWSTQQAIEAAAAGQVISDASMGIIARAILGYSEEAAPLAPEHVAAYRALVERAAAIPAAALPRLGYGGLPEAPRSAQPAQPVALRFAGCVRCGGPVADGGRVCGEC